MKLFHLGPPPSPHVRAYLLRRQLWRAYATIVVHLEGLIYLARLDRAPRLRRFRPRFWFAIGFLVAWCATTTALAAHPLSYVLMYLTVFLIASLVIRHDPPDRSKTFGEIMRTHFVAKLLVPALGCATLFDYNLNQNLREIGGGIGALWLIYVLRRARRRHKLRIIAARIEHEHVMWRRMAGLSDVPADETGAGQAIFAPIDGYGQWLVEAYGKFEANWKEARNSPGNS